MSKCKRRNNVTNLKSSGVHLLSKWLSTAEDCRWLKGDPYTVEGSTGGKITVGLWRQRWQTRGDEGESRGECTLNTISAISM